MSVATPVEQLEQAILKRAQDLVDSHTQAAQQQKTQILAESAKRQQLREHHETEIAKSLAEQHYRRKVQSSEIKMQAELDALRWNLIQNILNELRHSLDELCQQPELYLSLLQDYLAHAADHFPNKILCVRANSRDYNWLAPQWQQLIETIHLPAPAQLSLSETEFSGGFLISDLENQVRIDYTFEGLLERFEMNLCQEIHQHLFAP
jgi:V/A-type H+-transporting ATPase subunit E